MDERVPYVIVYSNNLERSVEFYHQTLGLPLRSFAPATKLGGKALAMQGTTIVLLDQSQAGGSLPREGDGGPQPGRCYLSFSVEDLAEFHKEATARQVVCVQEPRRDEFGLFALYRDPDGLLFSVLQPVHPPPQHAVVLSGGGALGAFELGVLSRLADDQSQPDPQIFTGTSVGGFNAALLACAFGPDRTLRHAVDRVIDTWRNKVAGGLQNNGVFRLRGDLVRSLGSGNPGEAFSDAAHLALDFSRRLANLATSKRAVGWRLLEMFDLSEVVSAEPLDKLVRSTISWSELSQSPRVLKLAATDWETGKLRQFARYPAGRRPARLGRDEVEITRETMHEAVLASAAIPGVFPPVAILPPNGTPFVDGGVVMNTPLNPAIDAGADVIHLICLNPEVETLARHPLNSTASICQRLLVAAVAGHIASDLDRARFTNSVAGVARRKSTDEFYRPVTIHRYHPPPKNLGGVAGLLDFSSAHIEALIRDGLDCGKNHDCRAAGCVIPAEHRSRTDTGIHE